MVVYDLLCKKNHRFEGWFPSFEEFQKQAGRGQVSCPTCGSTKVEKMPHACAVLTRKEDHKEKRAPREQKTASCSLTEADAKELLIRLHQHVKENFEDVGSQFSEEARAIFHGRAEKRAIHGTSTPQETEELDEEGIPYAILPKPELDS
ncbi:MAG TPA: DUF1178 family protein [Candidatus Binatia bacterium]|jgi:hypothetical protein|nr:DUF1178 family protein [Candidatus Binatia bacterium]